MDYQSFIEAQFPVSLISKESYKERKANNSQTLTGLGKWWGRKPLILVRATIIGLLMPNSGDPEKDRDIFLKIMTMDEPGLFKRKNKKLTFNEIIDHIPFNKIDNYLEYEHDYAKWKWKDHVDGDLKREAEQYAFLNLSYDDRLNYCSRPEQIEGPGLTDWEEINNHLGTNAFSINELVNELGMKQFGHIPKVGDAFCGGGSIPFEAARIGTEAFASDLNPSAALLTWASINIIGAGKEIHKRIEAAQQEAFDNVDKQIINWQIEHNEKGWRADAYLYCVEARSPYTGYLVPLAPSWVISEKNRVCAVLRADHTNKRYEIEIVVNANDSIYNKAKKGTVQNGRLICPETGNETPISTIRGDKRDDGKTVYGLRKWDKDDIIPQEGDVFTERLYFIRYRETYYEVKKHFKHGVKTYKKGEKIPNSVAITFQNLDDLVATKSLKKHEAKHYCAPNEQDLKRESRVQELLKERIQAWQKEGFVPSKIIPDGGVKTEEPKRTRGWQYWHHLFTPRQLLYNGLLASQSEKYRDKEIKVAFALGAGKLANFNSRLCRWLSDKANEKGSDVFTNQALNTFFNHSTRSFQKLSTVWNYNISNEKKFSTSTEVRTLDARSNEIPACDFWITDPPYADAVNYHELGDFFLAWYEKQISYLFPQWHADSKAALAVKGSGSSFNQSMVECYGNFTKHMPDNGAQVVMFTHQDASVWADLALILWASGLQVTAAWTIQTETDSAGIKKGNYVQGTVIMILRKQTSDEVGFLSDIQADVEFEVKEQLKFMTELDDKEDPNFGDADYQLAAYAAALRVLTSYKSIEDIDVNYELSRERKAGEENEVEKIIQSAVKVAMDYLVPGGFEEHHWRKLNPEERFYLKGLEVEKHGEYRSGVYQEMARGFGLREYKHMLNSGKANMTRLKTPIEFKNKELGSEGFGSSLTRNVLFAIYETYKTEDRMGRNWLANEWPDYWGNRQLILHILKYIKLNAAPIEHWEKDLAAIDLLEGIIENDHV